MTDSTRQRVLFSALAACLVLAAVLFWPRSDRVANPDPALSAEQLAALPDGSLLQMAATEIRWSMAGDEGRQQRWRDLNEAARTVLALSWVETGVANARNDVFRGFAALLSATAVNRPSPEDLAKAYEVIGVPEMAAVCREVQRIAEQQTPPVSGAGPYVDVDQQFRRMRETADTAGKLRTYIRQHAADIAAVRNR